MRNSEQVNWRINHLLPPHNLYSDAKHIPMSSQKPFHFHCSISDKYNSKLKEELHSEYVISIVVQQYLTVNSRQYYQWDSLVTCCLLSGSFDFGIQIPKIWVCLFYGLFLCHSFPNQCSKIKIQW